MNFPKCQVASSLLVSSMGNELKKTPIMGEVDHTFPASVSEVDTPAGNVHFTLLKKKKPAICHICGYTAATSLKSQLKHLHSPNIMRTIF